jgi:hypothetical protein
MPARISARSLSVPVGPCGMLRPSPTAYARHGQLRSKDTALEVVPASPRAGAGAEGR